PDITVDLHLTDVHTDLISDGFDAALRIAVMEGSSLVARPPGYEISSGWIYANQVCICTQGVQIFHSSHYRAPTRRIVRERGAMSDMGNRFRALDVLRGLTLALMIVVNMQIGDGKSYAPLLHAGWDGLTLTDLVFPTFMF